MYCVFDSMSCRANSAQKNDEGVGGAPHLRERTGPESAPVHNRGLSLRAFDPLPNRLGAAQGWEQDKGGNKSPRHRAGFRNVPLFFISFYFLLH